MDAASRTLTSTGPTGRRSDAGSVRLGGCDVAGLMLVGGMYGGPYDLLADFMGVAPARLHGIVAPLAPGRVCRYRTAGIRPGVVLADPLWPRGHRPALHSGQPALGRLAHIRAVAAVRLSLEDGDAYPDGRASWRSERRIRAATAVPGGQRSRLVVRDLPEGSVL
jgi:hypothetical protein